MLTRRQFHLRCLAFATVAAGRSRVCSSHDNGSLAEQIDHSLRRAAELLINRQADDGAWRSSVYGPLKDGPSLTSFIAATFRQCAVADGSGALNRAIDYLVHGTAPSVPTGHNEPLTYPVYSAAGALLATQDIRRPPVIAARAVWLRQLRELQLSEALGWQPGDLAYGGWNYAPLPTQPAHGHPPSPLAVPNMSATAFALKALRAAGADARDPAVQKAKMFVERCQNFSIAGTKPGPGRRENSTTTASSGAGLLPADGSENNAPFDDGGFFFLIEDCVRNKAGEAGTDAAGNVRYRSYGSATADGLRALLACGLSLDHPRVVAARQWLLQNFSVTEHPGHYAADREHQRPALFYYYSASAAAALRLSEPAPEQAATSPTWAAALAGSLLSRQDDDGGWRNPNVEIREDDPLVATPLAMRALNDCRHALAGQT